MRIGLRGRIGRGSHGLCLLAGLLTASLASYATASVDLAPMFVDGVVLQRGEAIPVFGEAEPGAAVTVTFAGATATAKANASGAWSVELPAMKASAEPGVLTVVSGKSTQRVSGVLVGDVWFWFGRSDQDRSFSRAPKSIKSEAPDYTAPLHVWVGGERWSPVQAENLQGSSPAWAILFARQYQQTSVGKGVPLGLVVLRDGTAPARAWLDPAAVGDTDIFKELRSLHARLVEALPAVEAASRQQASAIRAEMNALEEAENPDRQKLFELRVKLRRSGQIPLAEQLVPPGQAFIEHLSPWKGFAIAGVIREAIGADHATFHRAARSEQVLDAMVESFQQAFAGEQSILIMQQRSGAAVETPSNQTHAANYLQHAQSVVSRDRDDVGLVPMVDLFDKFFDEAVEMGKAVPRLTSLAASMRAEDGPLAEGPVISEVAFGDGVARAKFVQTGGELRNRPLFHTSSEPIIGFALAGEDRIFFPAKATLDGQTVVVRSDDVPDPVALRYDFVAVRRVGLYNAVGLPAAPYRTDDWSPDLRPEKQAVAEAGRVETAPKLDGTIADGEWPSEPLTDFTIRHTLRVSNYPTKVWLAWDDRNLYVAAKAKTPGDYPISAIKDRDWEMMYLDDSIEIHLDLNHDRRTYHTIMVTPRGNVYDGVGFNMADALPALTSGRPFDATLTFDRAWNLEPKIQTGFEIGHWTVEMAIPWSELGVEAPEAGSTMGLQLARNAVPLALGIDIERFKMVKPKLRRQAAEANEWSVWTPMGWDAFLTGQTPWQRDHQSPSRFGVLKLAE